MREHRTIERFPMRGAPYPDESFVGFIVRLTDENGYNHPKWIIKHANLPWRTDLNCFFDSKTNYLKLAELSYTSQQAIHTTTYPVLAGSKYHATCEFMSQCVPRKSIKWRYPKVCPECLKEQPYIRKIWDIALVTTCIKHTCFLIDSCPRCEVGLHALRPKVTECKCGFDFSKIHSTLASQADLFLTNLIWNCCNSRKERVEDAYEKHVLAGLELEELINTVSMLIDLRPDAPPKSLGSTFLTRRNLPDLHKLILESVARCQNWPTEFQQLLEKHLDPSSRNGDVSLTRAPKLIQSLERILLTKKLCSRGELGKFAIVRSAFANYMCARGGVYASRLRLKRYADIDDGYVGRTQAGEMLGKDHRFITQLILNNLVSSKTVCAGKHIRIVIARESILNFKERLAHALTRRTAAIRLGISVQQVNHLVAAGLFHPLCGPGVCGQADWRFDAQQVDTLLSKVFTRVERNSCNDSEGWIDLRGAVRQVRTEKMLLPQMLEAIIEGHLRSRMTGESDSIAHLRVSMDDLIRIKHERSDQRVSNIIPTSHAAKILGITPKQVGEFIRSGHLQSSVELIGRTTAYHIALCDIEAFQRKYAFPHEYSGQLGVTPITLSHLLILAGIAPISGPGINSTRYLFTRSEVEKTKHKLLRSSEAQALLRSSARTRKRLARQRKDSTEKFKDEPVECVNRNSIQLRRQIVAEVDKGKMSRQEIASRYFVSTEFVRRLVKQREKDGHLEPKKSGRFVPSIDKHLILEIVKDQPNITLTALVEMIKTVNGESVSINCVSRALIQLGLPRCKIHRKRTGRPKKIKVELHEN